MRLFSDVEKTADISDCGTYRYRLGRRWGSGSSVLWIMLNPSTADADQDDPTIRRCIGFAKTWGHDAIEVVNLYALRATDPGGLWVHPDPIGPDNGAVHREQLMSGHALNVAAWGATASRPGLPEVASHMPRIARECGTALHCLGVTQKGYPRHPLYVRGDTQPEPFGASA